MYDMEIVRYKFTCCACYKIFDAKSGGGICYVNCPYCGEQNKINTGEHARYIEKVPPTAAEERANYPTDPIDSLVFIRDGDVSRDVKEAKKSSFQVGDDVILELRSKKYHSEELDLLPMMLPAKITKYELHGMSLFKGPHYELVFQPVTDVPCITVERKLQKNGDSYRRTNIRWGNNPDAFECVRIQKYHPAQYPQACRDAIAHNNNCNYE